MPRYEDKYDRLERLEQEEIDRDKQKVRALERIADALEPIGRFYARSNKQYELDLAEQKKAFGDGR